MLIVGRPFSWAALGLLSFPAKRMASTHPVIHGRMQQPIKERVANLHEELAQIREARAAIFTESPDLPQDERLAVSWNFGNNHCSVLSSNSAPITSRE
jgi:hypothetical protein